MPVIIVALVWIASGVVVTVLLARYFGALAARDRMWRVIQRRQRAERILREEGFGFLVDIARDVRTERLTPAMIESVRAAQQRFTVPQ